MRAFISVRTTPSERSARTRKRSAELMRSFLRTQAAVIVGLALTASVAAAQDTYTLTVLGGGTGNGTVTAPSAGGQPAINCAIAVGAATGTCRGTYARNTVVTLTAAATGSNAFAGWGGLCSGTAADCAVRMQTGPAAVTATFAAPVPTCALTIGAATGGTATITSGTLSGACGRSVTLTATPSAGYRFATWTGGSTANPLSLVVTATASTVTPSFVQQCTLALAATPANGGTATLSAGALAGDCGRSVTALATPSASFNFTSWSDGNTAALRMCLKAGANFRVRKIPRAGLLEAFGASRFAS